MAFHDLRGFLQHLGACGEQPVGGVHGGIVQATGPL